MKLYFTLTKRVLLCFTCIVILVVGILYRFYYMDSTKKTGLTNADRVEYAQSLGITIDENSAEIKKITIPNEFNKVYNQYNDIQLEAGYNLKNYKGCTVNQYSYEITDYKNYDGRVILHLLIFNDKIIGGDICAVAFDGFMLPLLKK